MRAGSFVFVGFIFVVAAVVLVYFDQLSFFFATDLMGNGMSIGEAIRMLIYFLLKVVMRMEGNDAYGMPSA